MMPYYVIGVKLGFSVDSLCKEGLDTNESLKLEV
jgi:hypothetical protein